MADAATIITVVVSVATSTVSLAYWLGKKFTKIELRFDAIENRLEKLEESIGKLEERVGRLENVFVQFSEVFITMLEIKNLLTQTEAMTLRSLVRTILPIPRPSTARGRSTRGLSNSLTRT